MTVVLEEATSAISEKLLDRLLGDDDWTRVKLPTALRRLGLASTETLMKIVFALTEKKTVPQTERTEADLRCRIWRKR